MLPHHSLQRRGASRSVPRSPSSHRSPWSSQGWKTRLSHSEHKSEFHKFHCNGRFLPPCLSVTQFVYTRDGNSHLDVTFRRLNFSIFGCSHLGLCGSEIRETPHAPIVVTCQFQSGPSYTAPCFIIQFHVNVAIIYKSEIRLKISEQDQ